METVKPRATKARRSGPVESRPALNAWRDILQRPGPICGLLIVSALLLFFPVGRYDYVNYDDPDYVSANPHVQGGLTLANVAWAFSTGHASNWHPLTWLSHMLDCQMFGNAPGPQHLVSAILHALNTGLLFIVLRRLTGSHWCSALVAAWFGFHPLRVESVAWISERKDVLSTLFFLLTLLAYAEYVKASPSLKPKSGRGSVHYALALVCFSLGLMSKPMLVTVPFMLLLLDYWPLERFQWDAPDRKAITKLVLEKFPFLLMAGVSSLITFLVQRHGGAVSTSLAFPDRVANALVSYLRYIGKTLWPQNLSVLYPHPGHWPAWLSALSGAFMLLACGLVVWQIRRRRYFAVGWFWFIGGMVPVIGLIQVGIQSMADRYTYIPGIGLFIALAWGIAEAVRRWPGTQKAVTIGASVSVLACACVTAHQLPFWRDSEALFTRAVTATSDNYLAYNNLGFYLSGKGHLSEAKECYKKSIGINPLYADALNNLGFALAGERKFADAIPYYEVALRSNPNQAEIHNNYGNALSEIGKLDEAIEQYGIVLKMQPDHADAQNNLGIALAMKDKLPQAIEHFRAAIRAKPNYASAHSNLGNALAAGHEIPEAILEYEESLRLNPKDPQAHNNLANVLLQQGKSAQAIEHYTLALGINGNNPEAHFNLGVALARLNRRTDAAQHFREVLRLDPSNAEARVQLNAMSLGNSQGKSN